MSAATLNTAEWPPIGSRWREVDRRFDRVIVVLRHNERMDKVGIKTEGKSGFSGWAKRSRFNGKSGGYARIDA